jgi:SagB-type dehydrogenase family enzyme
VAPDVSAIHRYHDGTKHHFHRFARSLGYLDWASQPNPFRSYRGSPAFGLHPRPGAPHSALGDVLRHALGLSAWKQFRDSRWSLRVNPSSGNLHPTEAYVVCVASTLSGGPAVYHYAADRHELELRCEFPASAWDAASAGQADVVLVALTSIHWREAWKYGERAFRYCQHDLGHAAAAVAIAAELQGWQARMLPAWSHRQIAALTGIDRDADFVEAEREEPGCLLALAPDGVPDSIWNADEAFVAAVRDGRWLGRASQLSEDHVEWTFIDEVARATEYRETANFFSTGAGAPPPARAYADARSRVSSPASEHGRRRSFLADLPDRPGPPDPPGRYDRSLLLQRRSALAFDGHSAAERDTLFQMLSSVMPNDRAPWGTIWWTPRVHFLVFVHRVNGVDPGLYLLARDRPALGRLRAASSKATHDFSWEPVHDTLALVRLAEGDCRGIARRVSCDQDVASDGFFSLGMIAEFDASLAEYGSAFYRHLFWETGVVGQVLYLEAEAAGARATGIGCFYDDPVHDLLGLRDHAFQSLYHFTIGMPVDDTRLTTEPGYGWESEF